MENSNETIWRGIPIDDTAGLLVYGTDCRIAGANRHACKVLGSSEEELVGLALINYFTKVITPDGMLVPLDALPVPRALKEKKAQENRVLGLLGLGERGVIWAVASALPILREDGSIDRVLLRFMEFQNEHGIVRGCEQDNTEKALKDLLEFNRQIIASGGEGVIVFNKDLKYVLWNPAMEKITGLRQHEVLGKRSSELFPTLYEAGLKTILARALEGETIESADVRYEVPQTGKNGWISGTFAPHKDSSGRIIGIIAMVRDVTGRKKAEEECCRSEWQFRALMDSLFDLVYVHDLHGNFLDLNRACFEVVGYSNEDLSELTLEKIAHPDDAAKAYEGIIELMKKGSLNRLVEYRARCKNGSWIDLETSATLLYKEGKPYAIQGVARNITPHKRTEAALRKSEERFRTVFEQASLGMVIVDRSLEFTKVNAAFCSMLGYSAEELTGKTFRDITCADHLAADEEQVMKLVRKESSGFRTRTRYIRKDKSVMLADLTVTIISDTQGSMLCGLAMIEDLSKKRPRFGFPFFTAR